MNFFLKHKLSSKKISVVLTLFFLIASGFLARPSLAEYALNKAGYYFNGGAYDLSVAVKLYKVADFLGSKSPLVHYQLARIYFVKNNLDEAKKEIDIALAKNPENQRAFYIRGLIDGFAKNYEEAIGDFEKFTAWSPKEWAGWNDLAWVSYEANDYTKAKEAALNGLKIDAANPWLLNNLGLAYLGLGKKDEAKDIFAKTQEKADLLTIKDWQKAYPGNDPGSAGKALAKFKNNLGYNVSLVSKTTSSEVALSKGIAISACAASTYSACSGATCQANACTICDSAFDTNCCLTSTCSSNNNCAAPAVCSPGLYRCPSSNNTAGSVNVCGSPYTCNGQVQTGNTCVGSDHGDPCQFYHTYNCVACPVSSCTLPWGGTIASGSSVTAYPASSVPCGSSCHIFQTRTCDNGTLLGSYTNQNCSVQACPLPTVSLSASPTGITQGESSTLAWSTTNASFCWGWSNDGTWDDWKSNIGGSENVSPAASATYSIQCWNIYNEPSGIAEASICVGNDSCKSITCFNETCTDECGNPYPGILSDTCSGWSECSKSCGGGTRSNTCFCPSRTETQSCNTQPCPPGYREVTPW